MIFQFCAHMNHWIDLYLNLKHTYKQLRHSYSYECVTHKIWKMIQTFQAMWKYFALKIGTKICEDLVGGCEMSVRIYEGKD